jgi:lipopolysaccharide export system protein LptC
MAVLTAVSLCASALPGCRANRRPEAQQVPPELKLEDVRFRIYRGATLRASGDAAQATLRRDTTDVTVQDLVAILRRQDGGPVHVQAARGQGVLSSRRFEAEGGVVIERGEDVARTPSARYEPGDHGAGLVRGTEPITVEGPGYRLDGPRFTLDPATGDLTVEGGTRLLAGMGASR